jgi:hypothetical protein
MSCPISYGYFPGVVVIRNLIEHHEPERVSKVFFQFFQCFPLCHDFRVLEKLAEPVSLTSPIDHVQAFCHGMFSLEVVIKPTISL